MIDQNEPIALTGVVVAEMLQGLTRNAAAIEEFLMQCDLIEPSGFETYCEAATIYRKARSRGISLTTIDTLIAAVALKHGVSVFTLDQDFSRITQVSNLALYQS